MPKTCKICKKPIKGRTDKIFCSLACKNYYHTNLRRATAIAVKEIDKILHRNRSILLEIMGKNKTQKMIDKQILDKKKFNYTYHTHFYVNSKGKTYYYLYDFAWMQFSDDKIMITRKSQRNN